MSKIIYSQKLTHTEANKISKKVLSEAFKEAIVFNKRLSLGNKRIAYFFIDPLLRNFEAANEFYFGIFECESIDKINMYKSGASPIQALSDAKELIEYGLYDAVFIFGYEPLLTNIREQGKDQIKKAMAIFENKSIIECYNLIAHRLCSETGVSEEIFFDVCNQLYMNYLGTYESISQTKVLKDRGRILDDFNADLFKMTDCANPNIDFAGGIIVASDETAEFLQIPEDDRVNVLGVKYCMIEGAPEKIDKIVGNKGNIFPHLRKAFLQAQSQAGIDVVAEFKSRNLLLEVYTCYPPIPVSFLLASKIIGDISELLELLDSYEVTITGGMNFARAPWNNPALNGLITMYKKVKDGLSKYGLVHGNGGIGEIQGVAIIAKN